MEKRRGRKVGEDQLEQLRWAKTKKICQKRLKKLTEMDELVRGRLTVEFVTPIQLVIG